VRGIPHKGGRTFGYRVSDGEATLAYLSDHSPISLGAGPDGLGEYYEAAVALARGADLLMHDSQHTAAEFPRLAFLGHSAIEYVMALAQHAGARRVALFHHDPWRTDAEIDDLVAKQATAPCPFSWPTMGLSSICPDPVRIAVRHYLWLARSRPIRLLMVAWGVTYAGDLAAFTAASVYAYRVGGAGLVGILGLARGLPGALLVGLVTSWSDRVRRERLLIATVLPRALLLAAATFAMTGGTGHTGGGQALLVVMLVALEAGLASVFRQVQGALLPWLARTPDELTSANTAASVIQSVAMVGGPAIAAGLLAISTLQSAMLASCGLVAVGALLLVGVRPLSSHAPVRAPGSLKQLNRDVVAGFEDGILRRGALALVVPAAAQTFGRGVLNVLTVVIALDLFRLGSAGVGWLSAVLGVGGILAGPLAVMLVRGRRVARCFAGGVAGWGVPMILLTFVHARYWPYLMFGAIGAANVFDDAAVYSALQQVIPARLTGRALGMRTAVLMVFTGLGSAVAPPLTHAWGARGTLVATGLLQVLAAVAFLPGLTAIDSRIAAPGPGYALLRHVSFFGPLPFAIIEHLASELKSQTYDPGDVIIGEGEPGEHFYIIAEGHARVTQEDKELRQLGPGDSFGEIALLRRVPRTATVTAVSRLQASILAREEFLAAVTGNSESGQAADEVVSTRLQAD
jgi:Cyclic nucleotide-binding domain